MKIVVCGDSFCSADNNRPGAHFSELLEKHGHSVTNLARGGMSNIGIAFQMQEAMKFRPDLIIFGTTSARLTIPTGKQKFQIEKGLKNFCYPYSSDSSSKLSCVGGADAAIWADSIVSITDSRLDAPENLRLSPEQMDAVKKYVTYLHDPKFAMVIDQWIIGFWKNQISNSGTHLLELSSTGVGKIMYQYALEHPDLVTQAVFHTDDQIQKQVCQEILQHIELLSC